MKFETAGAMQMIQRARALSLLALFAILVASAGCSGSPAAAGAASEDELRTTYEDLSVTLEGSDLDRWLAARSALAAGFARACRDAHCSGDYANLATVRIGCSSTAIARKLKECVWVLGGSIERVDGATGELTSEPRVFTCKVPIAGTAKTLLDVLEAAGADAIHAAIPATDKSFYDRLVDCFAGVVRAPPVGPFANPIYVEIDEWMRNASEAEGRAWQATTRALAEGFERVCGDTFCEGEYSEISPLRFACSVNVGTKHVSRCSWGFALADLSVDTRGRVTAKTATKRCEVVIDADVRDLATVLAGPDPLRSPLPDKTWSIYDALVGCL